MRGLFTVAADATTFGSVRAFGRLRRVTMDGGAAGARVVSSKVLEQGERVREPSETTVTKAEDDITLKERLVWSWKRRRTEDCWRPVMSRPF